VIDEFGQITFTGVEKMGFSNILCVTVEAFILWVKQGHTAHQEEPEVI